MHRFLLSLAIACGSSLAPVDAQRPPLSADGFDLVISGARIVDGTGRPARTGDVGIRGRWIAAVAEAGALRAAPARDRIDGTGLVLAPGFVDVHSHAPEAMFDPAKRGNDGVIRMGVTTVVGGPDGGAGPGLMRPFIAELARTGAGTNVALYVGHNGLREEVMGKDAQRAPTSDEMA
ncbi:MAG TPA: hypothetical protein VF862_06685, partial [Gemmatimonadales bacterium]